MTRLLSSQRAPLPRRRVIRFGGIAVRLNLRVLALALGALAVLLALGAWALTLGSFRLPIEAIINALGGAGSEDADFIVLSLRLPRVLAAMLIGLLLAMSGAIFQGLVRNPLVSPDVIGINAGASLVAVWWIVTGQPSALLPFVAFGGALSAAALIYVLTWRGHIAPERLILVGIGANALFTAGATFVMVRFPIEQVNVAVRWMAGSVYASDWGDVRVLALVLAVLVPVGAALMRALRVLEFGDMTARSLGMRVEPTRLALMVVGCALSGVAVSVAGPVGFVAFMVPHAARMLAGPMTGGVYVLTGFLGAVLLLGADMLGQHALPVSLPAGVITSALGGPYFLLLLYRMNART